MMAEKFETFILQHPRELAEYLALLKVEGVRSYLEIGSKFGGLLWKVGNALPAGSRVVSIDLPWGDGSFKQSQPWLEKCVAALQGKGYDARLLIGDSHDEASVAFAEGCAPFDCVMIDGDHSAAGVKADWDNYGRLGRMVCFHDINWQPRLTKKAPIEVPAFWNELKASYRHVEIKHDAIDNGIGILWRD